jgi:hypothetical protein
MPPCPCCSADLSERQIRRHLATRRRRLEAYLDATNEDGPAPPALAPLDDAVVAPPNDAGPAPPDDADLAFDDADPAPRDDSPPLDEARPAHWRRIDIADLIAREDEDEDIGKHAHSFNVNC